MKLVQSAEPEAVHRRRRQCRARARRHGRATTDDAVDIRPAWLNIVMSMITITNTRRSRQDIEPGREP